MVDDSGAPAAFAVESAHCFWLCRHAGPFHTYDAPVFAPVFDEGVGAPLLILDAKSRHDKRSGGFVFLLFASRAEIWKMLPRIDKPTKGKIFEAPPGSELCAACAIDLKVELKVEQHGAADESADERRHWLVASVDMTQPAPSPTTDLTLTARP